MHFTAPVVAALAAFAATAEAKRYICDRQNYATVARNILNPAYFCKFYLKDDRLYSPLKEFGPKQLTHLCHCFVQNSPRVRGPIKSVPIPKANYDTCNQKHVNAIRNQYKQPVNFAKFWNKGTNRKYSPMPTIPNVKAVHKAASCVIASANNPPPPADTTTPSSSPAASTPASSAPQTTGTAATGSAAGTSAPVVVVSTTTAAIVAPVTTTIAIPRASTTGTTSTAALCVLGIGPGCPAPSSFSTSTTTSAFSSAPITASPSVQTTSTTTSSSSSSSSA